MDVELNMEAERMDFLIWWEKSYINDPNVGHVENSLKKYAAWEGFLAARRATTPSPSTAEDERAAFEAWARQTYEPKLGKDWKCVTFEVNHGATVFAAFKGGIEVARAALAAKTPAPAPGAELPPPRFQSVMAIADTYGSGSDAYTPLEVQHIVRQAIAADRLARGVPTVAGSVQQPVAWARKWHIDGEVPAKEKNEGGRWAWPQKFKFHAVTPHKVFKDDVPLYAAPLSTEPQAGAVRDAALEEAAQMCESEDQEYEIGRRCAVAVRNLKSAQQPENGERDA